MDGVSPLAPAKASRLEESGEHPASFSPGQPSGIAVYMSGVEHEHAPSCLGLCRAARRNLLPSTRATPSTLLGSYEKPGTRSIMRTGPVRIHTLEGERVEDVSIG
jgi:hypothetical protein